MQVPELLGAAIERASDRFRDGLVLVALGVSEVALGEPPVVVRGVLLILRFVEVKVHRLVAASPVNGDELIVQLDGQLRLLGVLEPDSAQVSVLAEILAVKRREPGALSEEREQLAAVPH